MENQPQIGEAVTGSDKAASRRTLTRDAMVASICGLVVVLMVGSVALREVAAALYGDDDPAALGPKRDLLRVVPIVVAVPGGEADPAEVAAYPGRGEPVDEGGQCGQHRQESCAG